MIWAACMPYLWRPFRRSSSCYRRNCASETMATVDAARPLDYTTLRRHFSLYKCGLLSCAIARYVRHQVRMSTHGTAECVVTFRPSDVRILLLHATADHIVFCRMTNQNKSSARWKLTIHNRRLRHDERIFNYKTGNYLTMSLTSKFIQSFISFILNQTSGP